MNHVFDTTAAYYDPDACDIADFTALIDQTTHGVDVPFASAIEKSIPVYDMAALRPALEDQGTRKRILAEWARVLREGAGVIALKKTFADTSVLDQATRVYEQIIANEKAGAHGAGDHFAAAGANDRVWNSLQKLCEAAPDVFLRYFANTVIDAACEAWLGPNYQMTAQVNLVHPGGAAQQAHRDYHLGFQTAEICASYPAHVHEISPVLTLQGAVAHCDMPLESGPTKLLPFSQAYRPGYAAWRRPDFRALFEERYIQLPLAKGDTLFFNPALFHAAGANTSKDIHRFANLLQVSSAFGRAMETIDRDKMCRLVFPFAAQAIADGKLSPSELKAAISATAEGYSFPTNLDRDPPANGIAPETQAAFIARALSTGISPEDFSKRLDDMKIARLS
ncbi:Ectoine hydroxylase-related dioxygenase, phytanoyl-CoA dioxygenase (PhyH) family [Yoonia rosea]|uniref:Ectoine hydroxylase-related dioxygenase, phytanoyl-CoA dioxygenase (PhyH) family n=1 Tax=Yoonia rosea TaxID=287098 RepID=A0A1R3XDP3_9RHOB|nr:phytanoyl-CoA dioxygenase family protein [Yoonia rosea]SIT89374.1 Ectoine hydroxylase-related dioxygenase, phytanoyl-CoA dioxygenase (PhyH) family [Yoonia rosea]